MLSVDTVLGAPLPQKSYQDGLKRPGHFGESFVPLREPFEILAYAEPGSASDGPLLVRPVLVIAKSSLPIAYISSCADGASHSRLFRTASNLGIHSIDKAINRCEPSVLIVTVEGALGLSAIEHVRAEVYSVSHLSPWIRLQHLSSLSTPQWTLQDYPRAYDARDDDNNDAWWKSIVVSAPSAPKKRRINDMLPKLNQASLETEEPEQTNATSAQAVPDLQEVESEPVVEDADTALRNLVMQYLDCLYISKASQAYFAKTPLARARQAFQQAHGQEGLVEALRHMILSANCLDKKHSTTIPDMVKNTPLGLGQDETTKPGRPAAKRKLKKPKPNREGIYSLEEAFVKDWWLSEQDGPNNSALDLLQKSTQQLRFRETLLQIILILEVMSLESHAAVDAFAQENTADRPMEVKTAAKSRKQREDLEILLDIHVDRLCIYQSLQDFHVDENETIHQSVEADEQSAHQPHDSKDPRARRDELKDFCTAVVIPFYSAKLPKNVKSLGRKVGVKVGGSSLRKQPKDRPAPGTEIRRRRPEQTRDPLARTASSQLPSTREFKAPSLSRSATDTVLNSFERQKSATPRAGTGFGEARRSLSRANSVTQSARGRTREVDMGAIYKFNESRQKKRAAVEQELKDAIATLKKPNRGLAVKEYVDASDSRKATASGAKSATRRLASGVQINATPKRQSKTSSRLLETPRRHDVAEHSPEPLADPTQAQAVLSSAVRSSSLAQSLMPRQEASLSPLPSGAPLAATDDELEDSDMDGFVPQSAIKTARHNELHDSPFKRPALPASVGEKSLSRSLDSRRPASLGAATATSNSSSSVHVATTPTKGGLTTTKVATLPPPFFSRHITTTPTKLLKKTDDASLAAGSSVAPGAESAGEAMPQATSVNDSAITNQPSIYACLGWDDEEDDI